MDNPLFAGHSEDDPPSRAGAIARCASATVSIMAETMKMLRMMFLKNADEDSFRAATLPNRQASTERPRT